MRKSFTLGGLGLTLFAALALLVAGCNQSDNKGAQGKDKDKDKPVAQTDKDHDHDKDKEGDGHGWWCDDHGIPEAQCSMCQATVEKECRAKGDWCNEHERALSQCFYHKPERRAYYAGLYKAKYGKEPPPIPEFDNKKPDEKK